MTKDEALRLALVALEDLGMKHYENTGEVLYKETFTAIKAALLSRSDGEAKDEPVAQWQKKHATKTEGKWENTNGPDAKWWLNNSVGWEIRALYTHPPQQEAKDEPWEKFCDSHCVWTDHHPDCKLAQIEQPKVRTGDCLRVGVCASEGHKIQPQRKPLTDEQVDAIWPLHTFIQAPDRQWLAFARAIEAAHGIKG